ncbi:hypothetical protein [Sphingomonas sp. ERG5]|uniref:hypothetical protein n=1 Tax=Sphingomonas sp. ERG5 TaxID=1381597 RepID=UPI000B2A39E4|nr:hypothetical protein [Sphingomonas sp. ERG5]
MILMAVLAAVTAPATDKIMMTAYDQLCVPGSASQAVLSRADQAGWQSSGPGKPKDFDPSADRFKPVGTAILKLSARETGGHGELFVTCGISAATAQPDLVSDVQAMLGFAPALSFGTSANFFALRENDRWLDGSKLTGKDFAAAKAAGKFYSLLTLSHDGGAAVLSFQVLPTAPGKGSGAP